MHLTYKKSEACLSSIYLHQLQQKSSKVKISFHSLSFICHVWIKSYELPQTCITISESLQQVQYRYFQELLTAKEFFSICQIIMNSMFVN